MNRYLMHLRRVASLSPRVAATDPAQLNRLRYKQMRAGLANANNFYRAIITQRNATP